MIPEVVVAPATPWGQGALAVVRLSGTGLPEVVARFVRPQRGGSVGARPRHVLFFDAAGTFDDGMAWLHRGPQTYTGEDVAELSCHGNPLLVRRLVAAATSAGARMATPGEFTRRALLNGKVDLVRAEAVLQLARATSQRGLDIGRMGLDGSLSAALGSLREELRTAAAELEARLDYSGDDLTYEDDAALTARLHRVADQAGRDANTYRVGRVFVDGARVAIVGAVNAGKSSLFNALLGRERAIVHETPGTTRDLIEDRTEIQGIAVTLVDTAGERETSDPVEAAGLALAAVRAAEADLVLVVLRARIEGPSDVEERILTRTAQRPRVLVYNGVDLGGAAPAPAGCVETVAVSGRGVDALRSAIAAALVEEAPGEARRVIASEQQRDVLVAVAQGCREAAAVLPDLGPAVAASLVTEALVELSTLLGGDPREEVLDALFARFCIGK